MDSIASTDWEVSNDAYPWPKNLLNLELNGCVAPKRHCFAKGWRLVYKAKATKARNLYSTLQYWRHLLPTHTYPVRNLPVLILIHSIFINQSPSHSSSPTPQARDAEIVVISRPYSVAAQICPLWRSHQCVSKRSLDNNDLHLVATRFTGRYASVIFGLF